MLLLSIAGSLVLIIGCIMIIVAAFRISSGWGLAVMFVPFAQIVFHFKHWQESRNGLFVVIAGMGCLIIVSSSMRNQFSNESWQSVNHEPEVQVEATNSSMVKAIEYAQEKGSLEQRAAARMNPVKRPVRNHKKAFRVVNSASVKNHIGKHAKIKIKGDRNHEGKLIGVTAETITVDKIFRAGHMTYDIARVDITELQVLD